METKRDIVFDGQREQLLKQIESIGKGKRGWLYGYRTDPILGGNEFHNGLDLKYAEGTPIYLPRPGKLVKVYRLDKVNGNALIFRHYLVNEDGSVSGSEDMQVNSTSYCHMSAFGADLAEELATGNFSKVYPIGTILGYVGTTGKSTAPHLHLVYRQKRSSGVLESIDPLPLLCAAADVPELPTQTTGF